MKRNKQKAPVLWFKSMRWLPQASAGPTNTFSRMTAKGNAKESNFCGRPTEADRTEIACFKSRLPVSAPNVRKIIWTREHSGKKERYLHQEESKQRTKRVLLKSDCAGIVWYPKGSTEKKTEGDFHSIQMLKAMSYRPVCKQFSSEQGSESRDWVNTSKSVPSISFKLLV